MIVVVKTFIDKTSFLLIPDPSVFADAFNILVTGFIEGELEKIQGNVDRLLTKKQLDIEFGQIPESLEKYAKDFLPTGIEVQFEFLDSELLITLRGKSTIATSTAFH